MLSIGWKALLPFWSNTIPEFFRIVMGIMLIKRADQLAEFLYQSAGPSEDEENESEHPVSD